MRSIFLVNSISGRGHLDAYARLYSRALVELGHRVVLVAESDGGTANYLARNTPELQNLFSFHSFAEAKSEPRVVESSPRAKMNGLQRAQIVWKEEGPTGILLRCLRIPKRTLLSAVPDSFRNRVRQATRAAIRHILRTRLAQRFDLVLHLDAGRIPFQTLLGHVHRSATRPGGWTPDLVFFLYLDLMAERKTNTRALDGTEGYPWAGILFHPRLAKDPLARKEGYFRSSNARGGAFLVPSAISTYSAAIQHLHFALVPDVADLEKPAAPPELSREILRRANGRSVVLQVGSIAAHKGISTLLDVIASADSSRFFFALVGEVYWESFGEQRSRVESFFAQPPENALVFPKYVQDERDYNGLILGCDVIYAVYKDFNSSSNSLTKAAGLGRPILVSDNTLMGDRVREFAIGSVAPEGDSRAIMEELNALASRPRDSFGFEQYQQAHSLGALKSALSEALPLWLSEPS
jgi:glycosyltransferase involved in cell wall biosynthesis